LLDTPQINYKIIEEEKENMDFLKLFSRNIKLEKKLEIERGGLKNKLIIFDKISSRLSSFLCFLWATDPGTKSTSNLSF
jgi:hypothetical protein